MKATVFNDKLNNLNNRNKEKECEMEISFQQLADKDTGEIIAIVQKETCLKCGESYVIEMWTRNEHGESLAIEMGFRDLPFDDYEDDIEDEDFDEDDDDEFPTADYEKAYKEYYSQTNNDPPRRRRYLN